MKPELFVHNTLSRSKEKFTAINPPFVGMYLCGPTVYGDAHLGHARPAITFDVIFRYLTFLGYKVRYVRNITDVGHLVGDADEGEDKIQKQARLDQQEPMEVAQYFSDRYNEDMKMLNVLNPSIQPRATGHIIEQIEYISKIIDNGYAYESNGSVYFDVPKYNEDNPYGELSGRVTDELLNTTRELEGQEEKRSPLDFALWKKAAPGHLMKWPSPWSDGFPGWHIECSAMSQKYLGKVFDIHGGGMDLLFPHHESEIAQSKAAEGEMPARYWLHNNMVTINGQKMGKSLNNSVNLRQFFTGDHTVLTQAYDPETIRFFILQAHYRGTVDFSNEALQAAEKALHRLAKAWENLQGLTGSGDSNNGTAELIKNADEALRDDFNTPIVIAQAFQAVRIINSAREKTLRLSATDIDNLKNLFENYLFGILGIKLKGHEVQPQLVNGLMQLILGIRDEAKSKKQFETSDHIRDELNKLHIKVKDGKDGATWELEA